MYCIQIFDICAMLSRAIVNQTAKMSSGTDFQQMEIFYLNEQPFQNYVDGIM